MIAARYTALAFLAVMVASPALADDPRLVDWKAFARRGRPTVPTVHADGLV